MFLWQVLKQRQQDCLDSIVWFLFFSQSVSKMLNRRNSNECYWCKNKWTLTRKCGQKSEFSFCLYFKNRFSVVRHYVFENWLIYISRKCKASCVHTSSFKTSNRFKLLLYHCSRQNDIYRVTRSLFSFPYRPKRMCERSKLQIIFLSSKDICPENQLFDGT